jgi:hypothetical protein
LLVLGVAFGPYVVFHLLFHEVVTVRYALPLIVPVAYLAVSALAGTRWLLPVAAISLAVFSVALSVRPSMSYARYGSPTFRLIGDLRSDITSGTEARRGTPTNAIGLHAVARRAFEWETMPLPVLTAPHGREWLRLVESWRSDPRLSIAFVADPRRTDLGLFDPRERELLREYRWGFLEPPFTGGARPGNSDLYLMSAPGWMLDRGWAITPEVAGITERDGGGPHIRPSVAWLRPRHAHAELILGGRHLGSSSDPPAVITMTLAGEPLGSWTTPAGFFLFRVPLAAGTLDAAAEAYLSLEVIARPASGDRPMRVALEQFDLQSDDVPMHAYESGWQEPEFNPSTAVAWRWMSSRATLWVRAVGRDLSLAIAGESPLRYFDRPPVVRVTVSGREVARFEPNADFRQTITLPGDALAAAEGQVVIESDLHFVPGDRDGSADRRQLALRIYSVSVR